MTRTALGNTLSRIREGEEIWMRRALALARRAAGQTAPNPTVGAVVVRGSRSVGEGFHRRAGTAHAEIVALRRAGSRARGATLYVTLEPCVHRAKRTPPCVPAILSAGIRRVVIAGLDPNPFVNGKGVAALRRAGVRVEWGLLSEEAAEVNRGYVTRVLTGRPFVTLKAGMSLDGRIALANGRSRWITDAAARREAHRLRSDADAILVGVQTVLADDPELSARPPGRSPRFSLRVVADSRLSIPLKSRLVRTAARRPGSLLVATTELAAASRIRILRKRGIEVFQTSSRGGRVNLSRLLAHLGHRGVNHVLVEGGAEIHGAFIRGGFVDRLILFVAGKILGGRDSIGVVGGPGLKSLTQAISIQIDSISRIGSGLKITARPIRVRGKRRKR